MAGLVALGRLARPARYVNATRIRRKLALHVGFFSTTSALWSQLPNTPIFRALKDHDPASLAVSHSVSGRSFTYGNLTADVARAKEDLQRQAAKLKERSSSLSGERVAFMAENSYDYVGV